MNRIKINYSQYLLLIGEVQKNKQMRKTFVFSLPTSIGWNYFKPSVDTFNALCSALLYLFFYCPLFCTLPAPPHTLLWLLTGKIKKSDKVGQFFLHFAVCWFFFFFFFSLIFFWLLESGESANKTRLQFSLMLSCAFLLLHSRLNGN